MRLLWVRDRLGRSSRSPVFTGPDCPADDEELALLDLSSLTPARLRQLDGQRLRLRVITDSGVWRIGDRDVFEAVMKDGGDDLATVWMYPGAEVEDGVMVRQPRRMIGRQTFGGFTEYRLAVRHEAR